MAIFNEFPQTNFHELNLDWLIKKMIDLSNSWDSFKDNWSDAVDEWLNEHPEITTTIQDGEIEYKKFNISLKNKLITIYPTVADMQRDDQLAAGSAAATLGFYAVGDSGSAIYQIDDSGDIALNNGLFANTVIINNRLSIKQMGATGDDSIDETDVVQKTINKIFANGGGTVIFNEKILIDNTVYIDPTAEGLPLALEGDAAVTGQGSTDAYSSVHQISRYASGDIFSVNRKANGNPYYKKQWSKFSARNLQIYCKDRVNSNVVAFHNIRDNCALFENIYFFGVDTAIKYDYSYIDDESGATVYTYNDMTQINNCHISQCKNIGFELKTGDGKSITNCSCGWCASGVKYGISLTNCREFTIKNFMFGNETASPSADGSVIYTSASTGTIEGLYLEFISAPILRAIGSDVYITLVYLKFAFPGLIHAESSHIEMEDLHLVSNAVLTGQYDVTGTNSLIKVNKADKLLTASPYSGNIIDGLNELNVWLYRRTGTTIAASNVNNTNGYQLIFEESDGTPVGQFALVSGVFNLRQLKLGTIVGVFTTCNGDLKTNIESLTPLHIRITNPDGTTPDSLPTGFTMMLKILYY